jgi:hypothetical protein
VLNDNAPFPLSQWFDLSKRISRHNSIRNTMTWPPLSRPTAPLATPNPAPSSTVVQIKASAGHRSTPAMAVPTIKVAVARSVGSRDIVPCVSPSRR